MPSIGTQRRTEHMDAYSLQAISYLEKHPAVSEITFQGAVETKPALLEAWDQTNYPLKLPHDLIDFYTSSNGLCLRYNVLMGNRSLPYGCVYVNKIQEVTRIVIEGSEEDAHEKRVATDEDTHEKYGDGSGTTGTANDWTHVHKDNANGNFAERKLAETKPPQCTLPPSKFLYYNLDVKCAGGNVALRYKNKNHKKLSDTLRRGVQRMRPPAGGNLVRSVGSTSQQIDSGGKTVMSSSQAAQLSGKPDKNEIAEPVIFEHDGSPPEVWFQEVSGTWNFLAASFSDYYRLLILHLGIPRWQYAFCDVGLDPTTKYWLSFLCPERFAVDMQRSQNALLQKNSKNTRGRRPWKDM